MNGVMNNAPSKDKFVFIKNLIERNGFKFTKQRKLILEQLFIAERKVALEYLRLNETIENLSDLEIYDIDIMFIGLCKRCRGANK